MEPVKAGGNGRVSRPLLARLFNPDVETLSPAYFGMVMATGIVSLAASQIGLRGVAWLLFGVAGVTYLILWGLTLLRIKRHPRRVFLDLIDHLRGAGFFTITAATGILGSECVVLANWVGMGIVLWWAALVLWLVLTYSIFTAFTVKTQKPTLDRGISGAWLLGVVATQAIAVLASLLAVHMAPPQRIALDFISLSMWLWGGMLYIWLMALIFYRYTFFPFSPSDLTPPYWINMGAMAISTLAGALLIKNAQEAGFLHSIAPFLKGFTIFYWASGTWWIPMLLILGFWRHIYMRFPLTYDPLYWGAVFPLGMYAVATQRMAEALELDFLHLLTSGFALIAMAAWLLTFGALIYRLVRNPG
ncbi:tellurite resistance/C4-dicarboxylate transporter family protein [Phaeovulum sp.]|uniref:tellurite resistance/C4-dicarboxylate transporter family protein n=1 Tax=Phaeovulum sp. TaxID=2934796 RepID=UPI0039E39901